MPPGTRSKQLQMCHSDIFGLKKHLENFSALARSCDCMDRSATTANHSIDKESLGAALTNQWGNSVEIEPKTM